MLKELFPKQHTRYADSPAAPWLQSFAEWIVEEGYAHNSARGHVRRLRQALERASSPIPPDSKFTSDELTALFTSHYQKVLFQATERAFSRFLRTQERLVEDRKLSQFDELLDAYRTHLGEMRGFRPKTVSNHFSTISRFLTEALPSNSPLSSLSPQAVEAFVVASGQRMKRQSLQHIVAHLRSFLSFCYDQKVLSRRLDTIDTSRTYRDELPPRALPWNHVLGLLRSIDRSKMNGCRDHAMLYLMVHYGLRPSEVASLSLDSIDWASRTLRVEQSKTRSTLVLPLSDEALRVLKRYLRSGRPSNTCFALFLRNCSPIGPVTNYTVCNVYTKRARESGLPLHGTSSYCLRHSFAGSATHTRGWRKNHWRSVGTPNPGEHVCLSAPAYRGVARRCTACSKRREAAMNQIVCLLDSIIDRYLQRQRALGRGYQCEERMLRSLNKFLRDRRIEDLDQAAFDTWCQSFEHLTATVRRNRQRVIRNFCLYRRRTEAHCFVPDINRFPRPSACAAPVIFGAPEVGRMLKAAAHMRPAPGSPLRPSVMRLAVVLLYTAGLRRGELVRLTLGDVDGTLGVLRIRESKFHKSRFVPLSPGARQEVQRYLEQRSISPFNMAADSPLLCHCNRGFRGYTGTGLGRGIRTLFQEANVLSSDGRTPRLHDFRHSFAVQALLRWYREGADVQSNLPKLAMYMGHVSIKSTAYYTQVDSGYRRSRQPAIRISLRTSSRWRPDMKTSRPNELGKALVRFFGNYLPIMRGLSQHSVRSYHGRYHGCSCDSFPITPPDASRILILKI